VQLCAFLHTHCSQHVGRALCAFSNLCFGSAPGCSAWTCCTVVEAAVAAWTCSVNVAYHAPSGSRMLSGTCIEYYRTTEQGSCSLAVCRGGLAAPGHHSLCSAWGGAQGAAASGCALHTACHGLRPASSGVPCKVLSSTCAACNIPKPWGLAVCCRALRSFLR
jgi:hypothetical protein